MSAATQAFLKLEGMVRNAIDRPELRPRTEAEEDHLALECLILEHDGPDALERYQLVGVSR